MSDEVTDADVGGGDAGSSVVNKQRRYFLIGATSAVGAIGVAGAAVPFIKSWFPSAKARAAGAPVKIEFSKLKPGEILGPIPAWRGKPVFVVYRDAQVIERLKTGATNLADPES
ncbi:MAG: hypothetical protein O3A63_21165, partial [Proteobacteria bacterium]|nr:hypothetical protein [Pseudomonadota bacterium]